MIALIDSLRRIARQLAPRLGSSPLYLLDEFERLSKLFATENTTFIRYNDGEARIVRGKPIDEHTQAATVDHWTSPKGMSKLGRDLDALCNRAQWYYGIPCSCCAGKLKQRMLSRLPDVPQDHITFGNLFVNAAFPLFTPWIESLKRPVVLLTNYRGLGKTYPFTVVDHFTFPDDCITYYENHHQQLHQQVRELADKHHNTIFLFSAGPFKAVFGSLYDQNPNNSYLDVGSAIGPFVHGTATRPYHDRESASVYTNRNCVL